MTRKTTETYQAVTDELRELGLERARQFITDWETAQRNAWKNTYFDCAMDIWNCSWNCTRVSKCHHIGCIFSRIMPFLIQTCFFFCGYIRLWPRMLAGAHRLRKHLEGPAEPSTPPTVRLGPAQIACGHDRGRVRMDQTRKRRAEKS